MGGIVIIPTYNEAATVETLLVRIFSLELPLNVLIVDDNSPDGTGKIVEKLQKKYLGRLSVLSREKKLGLGSAYLDGFRWALKNTKSEAILTMDADMSNDPKYIADLIKKMNEGYDVVIGSRYTRGGGQTRSLRRILLSYAAKVYANLIFGLTVGDNNSAYRCYRREVIEKLSHEKIQAQWLSFLPEILFYCKKMGCSIAEVPIFYVDRKQGKSKLRFRQLVGSFFNVLKVRWSN